jgi:hypothetical protein
MILRPGDTQDWPNDQNPIGTMINAIPDPDLVQTYGERFGSQNPVDIRRAMFDVFREGSPDTQRALTDDVSTQLVRLMQGPDGDMI